MRVRRARAGEEEQVVGLLRDSLEPVLRRLTIWGEPGAVPYVRDAIARPPAPGAHAFYVADCAGLAGVAEFRAAGEEAFLNHIYLRPEHRGGGGGRALLARGLGDLGREAGARRILLEVSRGNERARAWYERLGFRRERGLYWCLQPVAAGEGPPAEVEGLEAADGQHRRMGFSELCLRLGARSWRIGRLGRGYFRLSEEALAEGAVREALRRLDPGREALVIAPRELPGSQCVRRTERLVAEIPTILVRLGESPPAASDL